MSDFVVKICGITTIEDAEVAAHAGASAIGLNFVPSSPRRVDVARARAIADVLRGRAEIVGVVADLDDDEIAAIVDEAGLDALQLHGDETPEDVARVAERTMRRVVKAVRVGGPDDVARALAYPGVLLVDAKVTGALGGTGARADWSAAEEIAASRRVILAGGLTPDNVAAAIQRVRPAGVDTASGVESAPGIKDAEKVRQFVTNARSAVTL